MANNMREIFGEMLLTKCIDENALQLPSPHELRRKIILKHGKLPDSVEEKPYNPLNDDKQEMDLRNTLKSGILYMEDQNDKLWNPRFFVLTEQMLYHTDTFSQTAVTSQEEEEETLIISSEVSV